MGVSGDHRRVVEEQIDVLVAVDIDEPRPRGLGDGGRVREIERCCACVAAREDLLCTGEAGGGLPCTPRELGTFTREQIGGGTRGHLVRLLRSVIAALSGKQPAVDRQDVAVHRVGSPRREKHGGALDLVRIHDPAGRHPVLRAPR